MIMIHVIKCIAANVSRLWPRNLIGNDGFDFPVCTQWWGFNIHWSLLTATCWVVWSVYCRKVGGLDWTTCYWLVLPSCGWPRTSYDRLLAGQRLGGGDVAPATCCTVLNAVLPPGDGCRSTESRDTAALWNRCSATTRPSSRWEIHAPTSRAITTQYAPSLS